MQAFALAALAGLNTNRALIIRLAAGAVLLLGGMVGEHLWYMELSFSLAVFGGAYVLLGGDIIWRALKNIIRGEIFDENFLMAAATIGALALGEYAEAVAVMLFYQTGEFFQEAAVKKSRRTIASLMDIRPDYANLLTEGRLSRVAPAGVGVGELIVVKPGEKIPLDGLVVEGESLLDTAALTGESRPRRAAVKDTVLSGCVNLSGVLTIRVTQVFGESTAAKIISLVENAADKKSPSENFITKFARYYTPAVVGLAALIAVIPPLLGGGAWAMWLNRGLIFLVISCPCALVISIPLAFFAGIGRAAQKGILVKGGNYLEALNNLDTVVFDKTGTLTKGVFSVSTVLPAPGISEGDLLKAAAYAEALSIHPIALSIRRAYAQHIDKSELTAYSESAGEGVSVQVEGKTILAGSLKLMEKNNVAAEEVFCGGAKVYVARGGLYLGCLTLADELKPDSRQAIAALKALGVKKTALLTGDDPQIAAQVAEDLQLDAVYGGLLPQQKVEKVEMLSAQKHPARKLAFVGDGINDAPVLALADIGVAMGALGSDAAIEAADLVLMTDEPSKLAEALKVARFTRVIVWQNIIFALAVKSLFMLLGAAGAATLWEAVFADVGVALLAILNALRVLRA